MKYREIIKLLENDGWEKVRQKGSHRQYNHPIKTNTVTVAYHNINDDIPPKTLNSILKQAGLK